jgi:hypothetical protein
MIYNAMKHVVSNIFNKQLYSIYTVCKIKFFFAETEFTSITYRIEPVIEF